MEGGVLNPEHVKIPPEDQNAAPAAGQSAKPTSTPVATLEMLESAKPTAAASAALVGPESAKSTSESAELIPIVPVVSEVSSDDFASTVAALVSMEVPKDSKMSDEEMDD
jgi:hypothetical protein